MMNRLLNSLILCAALTCQSADERPNPASTITPLIRFLAESDDPAFQLDILRGMHEALQGRRQVKMPAGWPAVQQKLAASSNAEVRERVLALAVLFGDAAALATLRKTASDSHLAPEARRTALHILIENRAADLSPLLKKLLADRLLRHEALRGLASIADAETPAAILREYAAFTDAEKAEAVSALASRPEYAAALLDAMDRGQVPRRDLSPFFVRQILGFKNAALSERLAKVWGTIRPAAQDKTDLILKYKSLVAPDALAKADRAHGRAVFTRTCATCHALFGEGAKIGPDLTGSQRANVEYLLAKLLDPNAVVAKDYQMTIFRMTDGRVLNGVIKEESEKTVSVQTPTELMVLAKNDIEERKASSLSLMPEGQLTQLTDGEVRDLIAYLTGPSPLPRH